MNERIKELRKALGLTLEKFGEKLGVQKSAISKIERGENGVAEPMFKLICREFNVNENWLRTGEGEMFMQKTRDEEIASFINGIDGCTDSFKSRFIKMLASLDENEWKLLEEKAVELCKPYIDAAASSSSGTGSGSSTAPVTIRAAHMNPGATREQIAADDAMMESDDF